MNIILLVIRLWAFVVGSAILPCLMVIPVLSSDGPTFRKLLRGYLTTAVRLFCLFTMAMFIPLEVTGSPRPAVRPSAIGMLFRVAICAWALSEVVASVGIWNAMFYLLGINKKKQGG